MSHVKLLPILLLVLLVIAVKAREHKFAKKVDCPKLCGAFKDPSAKCIASCNDPDDKYHPDFNNPAINLSEVCDVLCELVENDDNECLSDCKRGTAQFQSLLK